MKTFIIDNSETLKFLFKYLLCLGLLIYTVKTKKEKNLLNSFIATFAAFSFIIVCNFLVSLTDLFPQERPFYDIVFVDFLLILLIANIFLKTKKEKTPPQDL